MPSKTNKLPTIDIKGKAYVLVSDRVLAFNEAYRNSGSITTELVSDIESDQIIIKATVTPDCDKPNRTFTGYSQAIKGDGYINKTAALENAETSAVGRALGMMGIGVIESIASADEINKATGSTGQRQPKFATEKQIKWLRDTAHEVNEQLANEPDEIVDDWIEGILTLKPAQVPIYKVKDAVDKLKEPTNIPDLVVDPDVAELAKGVDLNDIPY